MTTITIDRAVVEQALHVAENAGYPLALIKALRTALAQEQAEPIAWLRVIDEAMVTHHIGVAEPSDSYEVAKQKMNSLLCAAQDIGAYFAKQAEPVQEPAYKVKIAGRWHEAEPFAAAFSLPDGEHLLYTAPPKLVPLTDEEILRALMLDPPNPSLWPHLKGEAVVGDVQRAVIAIVRAVERKLEEKNGR